MGMGAQGPQQAAGGKGTGVPQRPVQTMPGPVGNQQFVPQQGMGMGKGAPAPGAKGMMPNQRPIGMGKGVGAPVPGAKGMMPNRPGVDVYKTQMDYLNALRGNPAPGGKGMMPQQPPQLRYLGDIQNVPQPYRAQEEAARQYAAQLASMPGGLQQQTPQPLTQQQLQSKLSAAGIAGLTPGALG